MEATGGQLLGMSALDLMFEVDYWGYFKSTLFYAMLTICAAQTFYPILMIIAMFIRQLGFLAQYFHEVSVSSFDLEANFYLILTQLPPSLKCSN